LEVKTYYYLLLAKSLHILTERQILEGLNHEVILSHFNTTKGHIPHIRIVPTQQNHQNLMNSLGFQEALSLVTSIAIGIKDEKIFANMFGTQESIHRIFEERSVENIYAILQGSRIGLLQDAPHDHPMRKVKQTKLYIF
jgi:hypothetical protein